MSPLAPEPPLHGVTIHTSRALTFYLLLSILPWSPSAAVAGDHDAAGSAGAQHSPTVLARVRHLTRVKILDANNASIRPGSVYDNITVFELLPGLRPRFNYEFIDTGLGAAEPLYPNFQVGHQGGWMQVLMAGVSEDNRHISHFSSLDTPEGCRVDSMYLLRKIDEYSPDLFVEERQRGFDLVVIRLEYFTRLRPDAQCGKHRANDPDPAIDPVKVMRRHRTAMTLDDFPADFLARSEAKLSVIRHLEEIRGGKNSLPALDLRQLASNSLWYYPQGHAEDYGIDTRYEQPFLGAVQARDLVIPASDALRGRFPLESLLEPADYRRLVEFLSGMPAPGFDPASEPGGDVLDISTLLDDRLEYLYTSGAYTRPLDPTVAADIIDPANYALVGITLKPFEPTGDAHGGSGVVPQVRLVFQLMDPRQPGRPLEQMRFHLGYEAVDRLADEETRTTRHAGFLRGLGELAAGREAPGFDSRLADFLDAYTARPVSRLSFGTSLSGIWIFGAMSRGTDPGAELRPERIRRAGIDLGYYSSAYDNDLFRAEIEIASGERQEGLRRHLDALTVSHYRDPKRMDVDTINFRDMTCAQCHQMSGRDAVHMTLNDGLDRRLTSPALVTEFVYREADRQLSFGPRWARKFLTLDEEGESAAIPAIRSGAEGASGRK